MDFLGVAEEITTDGRIIVKGVTTPEIGDTVLDAKNKRIGSVKRIFGPVEGPYISVIPSEKSAVIGMVGKKTYFEGATRNGKNKRRN
jgi:RNA-binding protein involved in rRNA processing